MTGSNRAGRVHRVQSFLTMLQHGQLWRCVPEDEAGKGPLFLYRKVCFHQREEIVGSGFGQLFPYVLANPFQVERKINFLCLPVFKELRPVLHDLLNYIHAVDPARAFNQGPRAPGKGHSFQHDKRHITAAYFGVQRAAEYERFFICADELIARGFSHAIVFDVPPGIGFIRTLVRRGLQ